MKREIYGNNANQFVKSFVEPLTREEEQDLFVWLKAAKSVNDRVRVDWYLTKIAVSFSPIVKSAAKELSGYQMEEEDLISEGLVALMEAANRFDLLRKLRFSTYAKWWVKGVMYTYIVKNYFLVHVCTNHTKKKLFFALRKMLRAELNDTGSFVMTQARAGRIADELGATTLEVMQVYHMFKHPYDSLSAPIGSDSEDGSLTKGDTIESFDAPVEEVVLDDKITTFQHGLVMTAMEQVLDDREKSVINSRVLSDQDEVRTLEQLGQQWSVSKERIRQIEASAMKKLRNEVFKVSDIQGLDSSDLFS